MSHVMIYVISTLSSEIWKDLKDLKTRNWYFSWRIRIYFAGQLEFKLDQLNKGHEPLLSVQSVMGKTDILPV